MAERADFDVIVVGAGIGGLACAALLAKLESKKVLVVEKETFAGGRIHHFKGDKINTAGDYLQPLAASTGWLARSIPDLRTIIEKGLFKGYSFELGMHDIVNGAQSRMVHILNAIGAPVEIIPLKACGFWNDGKLYSMTRGSMPWMTDGEYKEMREIIGQMVKMPIDEVTKYHGMSLWDFLQSRTQSRNVLEFFDILGSFTVGMNSSKELSAGEFILTTRMPMGARLHFADGTLGQMGGESFMQMAYNFIEVIRQNGGDILLGHGAERIIVENGAARGVDVKTLAGTKRFSASTIISNVPIKLALKSGLIPVEHLPVSFIEKVKKMQSGGAFAPIFGLKKSVIDIPGMLMTRVSIDDPLLPDGFMLGYEAHSLFVDGKAPEGKEIIECWVGLSTVELQELKKTNRIQKLCDAVLDFMKRSHPGFEEALEWALFPAIDFVTAVTPNPAQAWDGMLDPKCPSIDNLYFVGDSVKNYGGFMDGVAYGALLCTDAVTGKDYMKQILPPYQREL